MSRETSTTVADLAAPIGMGKNEVGAPTLTAVAMSGGLDSSVTAYLLARAGEPVVGLSMLLWDAGAEPVLQTAKTASSGRCCGALDLGDARRVAEQAGLPHYTLRMDREFREKVVDPFIGDYLAGRTPSPCVSCNTWVKFDLLFDRARALGAERIATGHYARILPGPDGLELHRAVDEGKDQSYFLFELTQEQLAASRFPLGEMTKDQVREIAREAGLIVAEKGESMETCFVGGTLQEFVEAQVAAHPERFRHRPGGASLPDEPAELVDREGKALGEGASPYYRYTVGQRKGLLSGGADLAPEAQAAVTAGERLYVIGTRPEANQVVVGRGEDLLSAGLRGERLSWIGAREAGRAARGEEIRAVVKIRSRHPGAPAVIRQLEGGRAEVRFDEPQRGVAPGQAAVFYDGTRVVGGCWIEGGMGVDE